ncbi:putative cell survival pathways protein [Allomyces arbusculus]|nr:putative cell survival pathways protein [Allomyces arbusculus]
MLSDSHHATSIVHPESTPRPAPAAEGIWVKAGYGYSETETFYLYPATGGMVYVQMAYSELSYSPLAQVSVLVATPEVTFFKSYNHSGSALKLSPGQGATGYSCEILKVARLPEANGTVTYQLSLKTREITLDATLVEPFPATIRVGDGAVHFPGDAKLSQVFNLRSRVTGTVAIPKSGIVDLAGHGGLVHQHQSIAPHKIGAQWNFAAFQGDQLALSTISGTQPHTAAPFSTLAMTLDGTHYVSTDAQFIVEASEQDKETHYQVPSKVRVVAKAVRAADGDEVEVEGAFAVTPAAVNRVDVLGELPWLIRKAIQLLVSKPYVYQNVAPATASEIVVRRAGAEVARSSGTAFVEVTYTNPQ